MVWRVGWGGALIPGMRGVACALAIVCIEAWRSVAPVNAVPNSASPACLECRLTSQVGPPPGQGAGPE